MQGTRWWIGLVGVLLLLGSGAGGHALPAPGQGVLIGLIDTGIDWTHPDFRLDRDGDGFEESSRLAFIWDQSLKPGPFFGPSPAGFNYGVEFTRARLEEGLAKDPGFQRTFFENDQVGHGTWTAGIAAGDGSSSALDLRGVAPYADLMVVKLRTLNNNTALLEQSMLDGVQYLIERAEALGRPLVINMSVFVPFMPRDGRDPVARRINALIAQHRVPVVVAAGNENAGTRSTHLHLSLELGGSAEAVLVVPAGVNLFLSQWWLRQGGGQLSVEVLDPRGQVVDRASSDRAHRTRGAALSSIAGGELSALADPQVGTAFFFLAGGGSKAALPGSWRFRFKNGGDQPLDVDGWVSSAGRALADFPRGNALLMVQTPATAARVITVGAYTVSNRWTDLAGDVQVAQGFPLRQLSSFSSCGPSQDGRVKPDLAAPGAWIPGPLAVGSAFSGLKNMILQDGKHFINTGTSAAAPFVAGAVALLLQVNPRLAPEDVRRILTQTATRDGWTGTTPNACWGFGKVDPAAALRRVVQRRRGPTDSPTPGD